MAKAITPKEALARAMTYRLLARAFGPPHSDFLGGVGSRAFLRDLRRALRSLGSDNGLRVALSRLEEVASGEGPRLEEEHTRLFHPSLAVQAPPYETEYSGGHVFLKAQQLADIAGFYRAFGLRISPNSHERPDHVAAELEFMYVLALKEARALARGENENAQVCGDAQAKFLRDHLGCWLAAYARRLALAAPGGFFAALGHLVAAFVTVDAERLGVKPTPIGRYEPSPPSTPVQCPHLGGEADATG